MNVERITATVFTLQFKEDLNGFLAIDLRRRPIFILDIFFHVSSA